MVGVQEEAGMHMVGGRGGSRLWSLHQFIPLPCGKNSFYGTPPKIHLAGRKEYSAVKYIGAKYSSNGYSFISQIGPGRYLSVPRRWPAGDVRPGASRCILR